MSRPPLVENMEETRPSELRELFDAVATEVPPFFGTGETHDRKILGFQSCLRVKIKTLAFAKKLSYFNIRKSF